MVGGGDFSVGVTLLSLWSIHKNCICKSNHFRIFISEKGPQLENCICRCICEIRVAYEYDWFEVYNASHAVEQFDDIPLGVDPEVCDFFDAEYCDDLCFEEGDNFFYNTEFGQPHPRV